MRKSTGFDTFLDTKFIPLGKKYKLAIMATLLLLPLLVYFFVFFKPKQQDIQKFIKQKAQLTQELKQAKTLARNLPKHQAEMASTQARFKEAAKLLPDEKEIPSLLTNISALGRGAGLEFLTFKPQADVPQDFYAEIPVEIEVRGPYHNMGSFLDQVSKLNRIVTVSNINMASPNKVKGEMLLDSSCRLVTYRFTDEELPKPEK